MDVPDHDEPTDGPDGPGRADVTHGTPAGRERLGGLPVSGALGAGATAPGSGPCEACGSPQARRWSTPDGPARLCPPCATLHGIGCP